MKTTKQMIEVMQAYERGEQIQISDDSDIWEDIESPGFDWVNCDYRVKPKKKYVPFDTAEEFLAAQRKYGYSVFVIGRGRHYAYTNAKGYIKLVGKNKKSYTISFKVFLEKCNFEDGTPCGKVVINET